MTERLTIAHAEGSEDMGCVRELFVEYQDWLGVDLCFQGFDEELENLPGEYAPPGGRLLLARQGEAVAGGVGMWRLEDGICEMKRLYVRSPWRGKGLGRRLAWAIVAEAGAAGYARMRLDTLGHLTAARALYRDMGFVEVAPYYNNPLEGVMYMELDLAAVDGG
ncbi:MAG: GNAT family N-acetyltransferase [Rhodospirillales bacterium]|jgi:GNAT superfamily N-acetyltransferase|nr:GNAT family N-acetyltransferase [Rhodospirillales bacterium]